MGFQQFYESDLFELLVAPALDYRALCRCECVCRAARDAKLAERRRLQFVVVGDLVFRKGVKDVDGGTHVFFDCRTPRDAIAQILSDWSKTSVSRSGSWREAATALAEVFQKTHAALKGFIVVTYDYGSDFETPNTRFDLGIQCATTDDAGTSRPHTFGLGTFVTFADGRVLVSGGKPRVPYDRNSGNKYYVGSVLELLSPRYILCQHGATGCATREECLKLPSTEKTLERAHAWQHSQRHLLADL